MQKADKERVVEELASRLASADSLIVADYRGLTNSQLAALRTELIKHGARLSVVKNTLTRRAAQQAGAEALLAMLEGPTAIAFVEAEGNPVAVAKALSDAARETKILTLRGGVLSGKTITEAEVESLAKLPPLDVLQAQLVGVIIAPLTQLVAVLNAPLQNLVGLITARIEQLEEGGDTSGAAAPSVAAPAEDAAAEESVAEPEAETAVEAEAAAEPVAETEADAVPEPDAAAELEAAAEAEPTVEEAPADEASAETSAEDETSTEESS